MIEKHIYKTMKPRTVGLIPSRSRVVIDGSGNTRVGAPQKGVKIVFTDGTFEINESTAASYTQPNGKPYTVRALVKVFEEHRFFGPIYQKVFDSAKVPTKEQIAFSEKAEESNVKRGTGVTQGPRAKKS
ncbi:hypothetical protein LCGC14_1890710 [marine sediment metagenome]|uniref:Uncharacterized protein n=1 Tax=marine sediment metagenome TaxID=412755 RepID=A0A0F9FZU3_9ZZZZ